MSDEPLNKEQIEPSSPLPINTMGSESSNMPPEAPESPKNADIPVSLNNDNPQNEPISTPSSEEAKPEELSAEGGKTEEINPGSAEPVQTPEPRTAQIPVNEPLNPKPEPLESAPVSAPQPQPVSAPVFVEPQQNKISLARELLVKARNMIQFGKRKKLDRVMEMFAKQTKITNDEVEKFFMCPTQQPKIFKYLRKRKDKIKQIGKTGQSVSYTKI